MHQLLGNIIFSSLEFYSRESPVLVSLNLCSFLPLTVERDNRYHALGHSGKALLTDWVVLCFSQGIYNNACTWQSEINYSEGVL